MTTIHPHALATAMANKTAFDLLDVRSRQEFDRAHIRGARSIPLQTLQAAKLLRERPSAKTVPLFVISRGSMRASLAAGILSAAGCLRPVVVEGGMELWERQGLPEVHPCRLRAFALARRLRDIIRPPALALQAIWSAHKRRGQDNAWWCRYEFQGREAQRG